MKKKLGEAFAESTTEFPGGTEKHDAMKEAIAVAASSRDEFEAVVRAVAREEMASLCALVLRRTQDRTGMVSRVELAAIFGEALRDFSQTPDEPGPVEDRDGAA